MALVEVGSEMEQLQMVKRPRSGASKQRELFVGEQRRKGRITTTMTFFIPTDTYDRLYDHARKTRGISLQNLMAEIVDRWLAENGMPPFFPKNWEELKRKAAEAT